MTRLRSERGQAALFSVVLLASLLGAVALVLDLGSWFRHQRATQSAADAAALAGAQALPESTGESGTLAAAYLSENGGGTPDVSFTSRYAPNDTVTVDVTRPAPGFFAKLFGIESVDVHATAAARAGAPDEARWAAPIAVDVKHPLLQCKPLPCFRTPTTLDLEKVGPGAFRLLNLDQSHGGTGSSKLAGWIQRGFDGMMPLGWYYSDPGAKFDSSHVRGALSARVGDELLFPVYDKTRSSGANFDYRVIGWVGFVVTDFRAHGNKGTVDGHFVRMVWEGISGTAGEAEDFGVRAIELVK